jgi:hypothetical protein
MFKALNGKGVSTALATTAIILVLVMSLTWMAYTVVLNARQQAQAAERAESIALKAKELIRVYVWLDPAQQTNGQYLNLTRISFVGSWSGETTINGLLVVYRDGSSRMLGLNIRLGAGEEKTYIPSELGIVGLDNYDSFRGTVKYIQAHTSLGNDFVSLWGRPDKPAIYIVTTTNTGTTTTSTTSPPTTTTTTATTTSTTTPPTTTTTTPPPTTTTTTPPPTVTTTVTVTETRYVYTRCTNVDWRYTTVTSWYTSTVYAGAVTTSTQWVTSTAWVTSTIPTTVTVWTTKTQTSTSWTTVVRWSTSTTVTTTTLWDYTTITITRTVTTTYTVTRDIRQISWPAPGVRDQAPDNERCGTHLIMLAAYNAHVRPSETMEGVDVSPALLATVTALMAYGSIGRYVGARRILMLLFSIRGVTIILLVFIPLFAAAPIGSVLAQVTSTVTSTRTVTSTVCTATDTVTYTSTVTQYMPTTTTITTTGTITVTSTATTTRTSYTTQTYTVTSTYYTNVYVTSTQTWTIVTDTTSWATTTRWITIYETTYIVRTTTWTTARCSWNCWGVCDGSIGCCGCVY